jgi:ABC-2 type transport system ATP-binding protein
MTVLELRNIHRSYERGVEVLHGVDLQLQRGEVMGLLGENGAGKTTLIKIALGMLQPHEGEVRVFGVDPRLEPVAVKKRLGYVSEDQALPHYLRIRDVIEMHRSLFPDWDEQLERDLCARFEFSGKEKIGNLSKGQARRVAVLCAIAHRPELLLLDEPAGGFDPAARREFLETALQLLSEEGSAILFSSHHMSDVERIAGRVFFLHKGHKLLDTDLDELREETTFVILPAGHGVGPRDLRGLEGCLGSRVVQDELRGVFRGRPESVSARLAQLTTSPTSRCESVNLEDFFVEVVEGRR